MRFTGGWVKLHRQIWDGDIPGNPTCALLWFWLIAHANYKTSKIMFEGKQRVLNPGQLVCGFSEIAEKLQVSKSNVHKWLHYLKETNRIEIESRTKGTVVTICNWDLYQGDDDESRTPREHDENDERTLRERHENAERTPREHHENLSEEGKKERKEEEKKLSLSGGGNELLFDSGSLREPAEEKKSEGIAPADAVQCGTVLEDDVKKQWHEYSLEEHLSKDYGDKEKKPKDRRKEFMEHKAKEKKGSSNRLDTEVDEILTFFVSIATRKNLNVSSKLSVIERNSARALVKKHGVNPIRAFIESAIENWDQYRKLGKNFKPEPYFDNLMAPWGIEKWDSVNHKIMENEEWTEKKTQPTVELSSRVPSTSRQLKAD